MMTARRSTLALALALALPAGLVASCNSDAASTSAAQCQSTPACGGDVVGTWQIGSSCTKGTFADLMNAMCKEATGDGSGLTVTGSYVLNADKTYATSTVTNGIAKITFPAACLKDAVSGTPLTCQQFATTFGALLALAGPGSAPTLQCSGTTSCACDITFKEVKEEAKGQYTLASNRLSLKSAGNDDPDVFDYCVKGTTLTLSPVGSAGEMPQGTITLNRK